MQPEEDLDQHQDDCEKIQEDIDEEADVPQGDARAEGAGDDNRNLGDRPGRLRGVNMAMVT
jgi:hypothetical protein